MAKTTTVELGGRAKSRWAGVLRVVADYFWGPLLGASLLFALWMAVNVASDSHYLERGRAGYGYVLMGVGSLILGMTLSLRLGFPTPPRGIAGHIGRAIATAVILVIEIVALVVLLSKLLFFVNHLKLSRFLDAVLLIPGPLLFGLGLLRALLARRRAAAGRSRDRDLAGHAPADRSGDGQRSPFPGPQPYRAADRARFFGRDATVRKLANQLLARPATTVYGPSGAGKSSLMQAGVIPALEDSEGLRVVRVDAWPAAEAPLPWLVDTMWSALDLGDRPGSEDPLGALEEALDRAARRSERTILIYLDQIEQLFVADHPEADLNVLLQGLDSLTQPRRQEVHLVLSVREDYLGRVRDWTRERAELSAHGFRVGPLSVGEMVKAMCWTAAAGEPAQHWDEDEIRALMLDVRVQGQSKTDKAEVQTAFGQIVCRALWEDRAAGKLSTAQGAHAEAILQRYLDATVEGLGAWQEGATKLLEEHLIDEEGHRKLLTEKEARQALPGQDAAEVLGRLERAAVLHAEEHQGSRYFELGHDWLAKKVLERKIARMERVASERAARRRRRAVTAGVLVLAGIFGALGLRTVWSTDTRHDPTMEGAWSLFEQGQTGPAALLLLEVKSPGIAPGWFQLATAIVAQEAVKSTLPHKVPIDRVAWSPDSKRIVTVSDGVVRVWNADGSGDPLVLENDPGAGTIKAVAWIPDGERIVAGSNDGTVQVWNANRSGSPLQVIAGQSGGVIAIAGSPDGKRIVTGADGTAQVWNANRWGSPLRILEGHKGWVTSVAWSPDGTRIVTGSHDGTARVWSADGSSSPLRILEGHEKVTSVAWSPDGTRIVIASWDGVRVWNADGEGPPRSLQEGHRFSCAAWSPDDKRIVAGADDGTARVWNAEASDALVVLRGYEKISSVAWSPDGKRIVTASGHAAEVWNVAGLDGKHPSTAFQDEAALQKALHQATKGDCLIPELRRTYLLESAADARAHYEACQRSQGN